MDDDIQIDDSMGGGGSGKSKDKRSFKNIVLDQYKRCCDEGSKEMTTGGVRRRILNNELVEFDAPNQIELFINNVEILRVLLAPYIIKHKNFIEPQINDFDNKLSGLEDKYRRGYDILKINLKKNRKNDFRVDNTRMIKRYEDEYNMVKFEFYKNGLFKVLSLLLNKINYLDSVGMMG